jgi:hypothetical protein
VVRGDQVVDLLAQQRGGERVLEDPWPAVDDQVSRPGSGGGQGGPARLSCVH